MKLTTLSTMALVLLVCAGVAVGQSSNSSSANQTIQGCLRQTGGDFILTTTGPELKQYMVMGDTGPLATHVGQVIAVTGNITVPAANATGQPIGSAEQSGGANAVGTASTRQSGTIQMNSFRKISDTCSSQ
jgi:hypothetical protein